MNKRLEYAKKLVADGYKVFPLLKDSKKPLGDSNGFKDATDALDQIEQWWGNNPGFNIGIRTGKVSNLTVVDVDNLAGGMDSIRSVIHLLPKDTWVNKTPHGYHLCFQYNPDFKNGVGLLDGVDVRNDKGYIVAPTSYVVCDKSYCNKHHHFDYKIYRDLPKQPISVVPEAFTQNGRTNGSKVDIPDIVKGVPEGSRDASLTSYVGKLFRMGLDQELVRSILYTFADNCDPPLSHQVVDEKINRLPQVYEYPEPIQEEEDGDPIGSAYKRMSFVKPNDWLSEVFMEDTWVVDGLVPEGTLTMVNSFPKGGKSTFTRHMAVAVSKGEEFLGRSVQQGKVLYLALEEKPNKVKRSFKRLGLTEDDPLLIKFGRPSKEANDDLRAIAEQEKPRMIVIDTVTRMPKKIVEMADYFGNSEWLETYLYMAHEINTAVVVNYHSSRNGRSLEGADAIASPIGSTGILGTPDQIVTIKVETDYSRSMSSTGRYDPVLPTILAFDKETERLSALALKSEIKHHNMREAITDLLIAEEGKWVKQTESLKEVTGKAKDKGDALLELIEEGLVERKGGGGKGDSYQVRASSFLFPFPYIGEEMGKGNDLEDIQEVLL